MQTRRAFANIHYRGREYPTLDFSYTDNNDITDDISATVADKDDKWITELFPEIGEVVHAAMHLTNWNGIGDNRSSNLFSFEIDNPSYNGPFTINAVSVPITHSARSEKKNRSWRQILLSGIAGDFATNAGLRLFYDTSVDPFYDNIDQNDKSDLQFLQELCKSDGLSMKISNGQLIIFEEWKYEQAPSVMTIEKGQKNIIGKPKFNRNSKDVYRAAEITFFNPQDDVTYVGFFEDTSAFAVGHIFRDRERFNSVRDDINLDRKARARLREKNKNQWTIRMTLTGDITYFAGTNVDIVGWGRFDGKYHIVSCSHKIKNAGYTVKLNLRRCLEGY